MKITSLFFAILAANSAPGESIKVNDISRVECDSSSAFIKQLPESVRITLDGKPLLESSASTREITLNCEAAKFQAAIDHAGLFIDLKSKIVKPTSGYWRDCDRFEGKLIKIPDASKMACVDSRIRKDGFEPHLKILVVGKVLFELSRVSEMHRANGPWGVEKRIAYPSRILKKCIDKKYLASEHKESLFLDIETGELFFESDAPRWCRVTREWGERDQPPATEIPDLIR